MHLFGDPNFPKRNLTAGGLLLTVSSFQVGTIAERLIWRHGSPVDYLFLVLFVGVLFASIKMFRLGLASVPPDPGDQRMNQRGLDQRGPGFWIRRVLFWIVIITAPVAIIQFCARSP